VTSYARFSVEERRARLLELGLRLFGSRPYDDVSVEEIAQMAGVSKGLLYHYFPSKRDFYVACLEEAATEVRRTLQSDQRLGPEDRVRAVLAAYLDHVSANLPQWQALLRGGIGSDPAVAEITEAIRRMVWTRMLDDLGASSDEHLLRAALRGWISFVETAALDWAESGARDKGALIEVMVGVLGAAIRRARPVAAAG
jgi:AcrR family transcriptional regulator